MKTEFQTHDLTLPAWGPYTKKYSGISHIPDANDGVRFDLAVFPGLYRRRVDVPDVRFESGYHLWAAAPDLSCYTMRHELEWKDRVYADISFAPLFQGGRLIRAECCNHTDTWQNLVLHYMASAWDPVPSYCRFDITGAQVRMPENTAFLLAKDYDDLRFAVPRPRDHLGWDGMRRGEEPVEGFVAGYGIGQNFGCGPGTGPFGQPLPGGRGDWVRFTLRVEKSLEHPCLGVRYVNPGSEASVYTLPGGPVLELPPARTPAMAFVPLPGPIAPGEQVLELTAAGLGSAKLDCLFLCEEERREEISVLPRGSGACPEIHVCENEHFLTLHYPHIREFYGIAWDYEPARVRQITNDELDIFLRDTVHDHVSSVLRGNGKGHFTNVFLGPIPLAPGESRTVWGVVCSADTQAEAAALCREALSCRDTFDAVWRRAAKAMEPAPALEQGKPFALGQQLMQAVLCTNVVYPVYTRGQYIRHNTPGRWWDSLYTWDSGFIGMGLTRFSLRRGFDCLNAYLTAPGDDEAAFIHHGSLVPTQFYLYQELWNQTQSLPLARYCYPRLMQYYRFLLGQDGSTTADPKSGLLRPWDYFYNSGGWDDYPPQKTLHQRKLEASCTPVVTTAHAIRCGKILAQAARILGKTRDEEQLLADAARLTRALEDYAWDGDSGYFGYVLHDADGLPEGILRDETGANHNMGLGGASPLFAGACGPEQSRRIWENLENSGRLWCGCGLSTVDQRASYYRRDGYWNGAVWMPYQWLFFKAALDEGRTDFAFRLADTLLRLWEQECRASYHCFEHFMIESRRGAGWHQFGGLSAPVVQFFASYYRPGTLTTGFDTFVREARWSDGFRGLEAELECTRPGPAALLVVTAGNRPRVRISVPDAEIFHRFEGLTEIRFRVSGPGSVRLSLESEE